MNLLELAARPGMNDIRLEHTLETSGALSDLLVKLDQAATRCIKGEALPVWLFSIRAAAVAWKDYLNLEELVPGDGVLDVRGLRLLYVREL